MLQDEPPLDDLKHILADAYPNGVPEDQYHALLTVLYSDAGNRLIASAVGHVSSRSWEMIFNDLLGVHEPLEGVTDEVLNSVSNQLKKSGYEQWLKKYPL